MRNVRGFTLVELMVTVVVAAILLSIAIPNFATMLRKNRAATDVSALTTTIAYARSESVARGRNVCITPKTSGGAWKDGWQVRVDDATATCTGDLLRTFSAAQGSSVLTVKKGAAASSATAITTFAFTSGGYRSGGDGVFISYVADGTCDPDTGRLLSVLGTGRLSIDACTVSTP